MACDEGEGRGSVRLSGGAVFVGGAVVVVASGFGVLAQEPGLDLRLDHGGAKR